MNANKIASARTLGSDLAKVDSHQVQASEYDELPEHFSVVGTHSLYAYESACGVRFVPAAMATRDIDPLVDTRKHLAFFSRMKEADASFLGLLKKADKTFVRLEHKKETARNAAGFEVDVIRRMAKDGDPHPFRGAAPRAARLRPLWS